MATMGDGKLLSEARRRIDGVETALLSLDEAQGVYNPTVRDRLIAELRRALDDYYSLVSGQSCEQPASNPFDSVTTGIPPTDPEPQC